jgi:hypothetical protein
MRLQNASPERWKDYYLDVVRNMKPGLNVILVHLGYDDAELRAVTTGYTDWEANWRQKDYDLVNSAEFKQALKDNGVTLVTWREVGKAMYP